MPDIQSLSFNISADAGQASKNLDQLVKSLENLKAASSGGTTQLRNLATNLGSLSKSVSSLGGINTAQLTELSAALRSLKGISLSKSTVSNLTNLGTALKGIDTSGIQSLATNITTLGTALATLKGSGSSFGTLIKRLAELPAVMRELKATDLATFTRQIQQLASAMAPLAKEMATVGTGFSQMAFNIRKAQLSMQSANITTAEAKAAFVGLGSGLSGAVAKLSMFALGFHVVKGIFDNAISLSNEYQENLNLFTVAMGDSATAAQEFAEKVSDAVGIDPAEWMRNQGVFNTLLTGFGVVGDKAEIMSQNLTQLGYDLASFFNLSTEDALTKIQSGISGELEPLRRLGYDLSVTRLQQEAYNLGIEKSVNAMTQAEKAQLRYHAIMTQVTTAQGDMARTINAPANQLRVLKAQVTMAARAFGNIFIPILNVLLPLLIAVAKAVRIVAASIASLFGFKLAEVDYDGVQSMGDSLGTAADNADDLAGNTKKASKAAKKAAKEQKKYNRQLLGFDRINNLTTKQKTPKTGTGGTGGGGGAGGVGAGGGFDIPIETYDFLQGLEGYLDDKTSKIRKFADWVSKHIKGVLSVLAATVSGFLGVLGINKLVKFGQAMMAIWGSKWFFTMAGQFAVIAGAVLALLGAIDALKNGLTTGNLAQIFAGIAVAVGGAALAFGSLGAMVAAIIGGALLVFVGISDAIKNGFNKKNLVAIAAGLGLVFAALVLIGGITAPVAAVVALAVGVVALGAAIVKNRKKILGFLEKKFPGAMKFLEGICSKVKNAIGGIIKGIINFIKNPSKALKGFGKAIAGMFSKKNLNNKMFAAKISDAFKGAFKKVDFNKLLKAALKSMIFPLSLQLKIADKALDAISELTGIDIKANFSGWVDGAKSKFDTFKSSVSEIASDVRIAAYGWASSIEDKWTKFKNNISGAAKSVKITTYGWASGIKDKWNKFKKNIKGKTVSIVVNITSSIKKGYNSMVEKIKKFHNKHPILSNLFFPNLHNLPTLARGGYVNQGQMFIAREAGPEMVGKIGNKSAVANNAQIEGSIARSVAQGNVTQNMLLRQLINAVNASANSSGGSAEVKLIIDGQTLGKAAIKNINKVQRQQGRTLLEV